MAQSTKGRLNYRCPSCFMRDLDIDMFYDSEKQEFYCIRCQFFGTEEQVLKMNEMVRVRYKDMMKRFTDFEDFSESRYKTRFAYEYIYQRNGFVHAARSGTLRREIL